MFKETNLNVREREEMVMGEADGDVCYSVVFATKREKKRGRSLRSSPPTKREGYVLLKK
jgi:hypothetical protein